MQFRFLKALGHLKPPWTHFEAHHIRHCLSHHAQPTFDLTCHTSLLIPKLSSQLSSELFCSTYKHQPQGPAGVNKWIHFFYIFTNVGIRIQTEGRADWGSMSQNHRMKSYPQQWQLDFNCKFHTEENVWKHQLFWEQKPPPSICCSAERAQDTLTFLSFSSLMWPCPEQGDQGEILDS